MSVEELLLKGKDLCYISNRLQEALDCLNEAIRIDANYVPAYIHKANLLHMQRNDAGALECLSISFKLDRSYALAYYIGVRILWTIGNKSKAEEWLKIGDTLLKNDNAEDHSNRGRALYSLGKQSEAIECYDKAITLEPNDASVYFDKGLALKTLNKVSEAIEYYNKAIALNHNYASAYFNKGTALKALKKLPEAIECYNKAIEIDSGYTSAYFYKGFVLDDLKKLPEAIECYDKVISLDPDHASAYFNKGLALKALKKLPEAVECYDKSIALNPKYASVYNGKGVALKDLNKTPEAIECYNKAIALDSNYTTAYFNKGNALKDFKKLSEAIECYDKAITINPKYTSAYSNKGITLADLGRLSEAIECYDKVISLDPNYASAYSNKGTALKDLKRLPEAIECYNTAITIQPSNSLYYCNKGRTLNSLGQEVEALACFNKAFETSQSGNLNLTLTEENLNYINQTLSKHRETLLKKAIELQNISVQTQELVDSLDKTNPVVNKVIEKFTALKQAKNNITNQVVDNFDKKDGTKGAQSEANASMLKEMEKMKKDYEALHQQVQDQNLTLQKHEQTLQEGGVYDAAEITMTLKKLADEDEELYLYYKIFYWTLANYLQAYRVASTGMVLTNNRFGATEKDTHIEEGAKKAASYLIEAGKGLPIVGGVIESLDGLVDSYFDQFYDRKLDNKKNAINNIIKSKLNTEQELSTRISQAAIGIIECKKSDIQSPRPKETSRISKTTVWIGGKVEAVKKKLIGEALLSIEDKDSPAAEMAVEDVVLLLIYLYDNSEQICKKTTRLDKVLIAVIKDKLMEKTVNNAEVKSPKQELDSKSCVTCSIF